MNLTAHPRPLSDTFLFAHPVCSFLLVNAPSRSVPQPTTRENAYRDARDKSRATIARKFTTQKKCTSTTGQRVSVNYFNDRRIFARCFSRGRARCLRNWQNAEELPARTKRDRLACEISSSPACILLRLLSLSLSLLVRNSYRTHRLHSRNNRCDSRAVSTGGGGG